VARGTLGGVDLTRPAPAADKGLLDDTFYDLVETRFRDRIERDPVSATYLGIHAWDDQLGDPSRDAALEEIESDRRHLAAIEALDTPRRRDSSATSSCTTSGCRSSTAMSFDRGSVTRPAPRPWAMRSFRSSPATMRR